MRTISVHNLTQNTVRCTVGGNHLVVLSSKSITATISNRQSTLGLVCLDSAGKKDSVKEKGPYSSIEIALPPDLGRSCRTVKAPADSPWRIFCTRVSRKHQKLSILPRRNLSSFLSEIPDTVPLSSLLLPGTHDTMAFYGWPISQCQSGLAPLDVQLQSGIRVIDIRLAVIESRLIAYHGSFPERTPFQSILSTIHSFLTGPLTSSETIIMSIKQEDFASVSPVIFSQVVHEEIFSGAGGKEMWFFENRIPTLGEVRGKVVMFSRFGGNGDGWEGALEGMGIHPSDWPDSEKAGFTWQCKDTLVRTHDWYSIPSFLYIPEKVQLSTQILLSPPDDLRFPLLNITYFSAASFPLAFAPLIAKGFGWPKIGFGVEGVNERVGKWLVDLLGSGSEDGVGEGLGKVMEMKAEEKRIRGWVFMDYYDSEEIVVPLLVEGNFRGRKNGEEGWSHSDAMS